MSDTKRYRVCETCNKKGELRGPKGGKCPDCGHGDCAPGVVDAGVVWQSEVPTSGAWVVHVAGDNPRASVLVWFVGEHALMLGLAMGTPIIDDDFDLDGVRVCSRSEFLADGCVQRMRFAPLTIPAPPKE